MKRAFIFLVLTVCLASSRARADEVVFRSDVALVRVDVQALDRSNRAITGLTAEDFILLDQGQPRTIRNFASEHMPMDVLLLLDVSGSMRIHLERISKASHEALNVLGKDDRVAVMVFDTATRLRLPFQKDLAKVERDLESLLHHEGFNGGTNITRAMIDAAVQMRKQARKEARRAILIVTDDQQGFARDDARVLRELAEADAVLSAILAPSFTPYGSGGRYPGGRGPRRGRVPGGTWPGGGIPWPGSGGPLGGVIWGPRGGGSPMPVPGGYPRSRSAGTETIARESGGDTMHIDDAAAFETTLARLRQRYALYFNAAEGQSTDAAPPEGNKQDSVSDTGERAIEVRLARTAARRYAGAELRYRRAYSTGVRSDQFAGRERIKVSRVPAAGAAPVDESAKPTPRTPSSDSGASTTRRRRAVNETGGRPGPLSAPAPAGQP